MNICVRDQVLEPNDVGQVFLRENVIYCVKVTNSSDSDCFAELYEDRTPVDSLMHGHAGRTKLGKFRIEKGTSQTIKHSQQQFKFVDEIVHTVFFHCETVEDCVGISKLYLKKNHEPVELESVPDDEPCICGEYGCCSGDSGFNEPGDY